MEWKERRDTGMDNGKGKWVSRGSKKLNNAKDRNKRKKTREWQRWERGNLRRIRCKDDGKERWAVGGMRVKSLARVRKDEANARRRERKR